MNDSTFSKRPALLIGVGGTGLRIARGIHSRVVAKNDAENMKIAVVGFDTDTGDIRIARSGEGYFPVVQVSTEKRVYEVLDALEKDPARGMWPDNSDIPYDILNRNLLLGAGQVRMLSSMGLYYVLGKSNGFKDALREVQADLFGPQNHPDEASYDGNLDVLIVGSFAGGTGSGIFLQVALVIRDWLNDIGAVATVRGLLLLPNVFIGGGLPASQSDAVRANAYSALREVHSAMQSLTGRAAEDFEFHYAPDKRLAYWSGDKQPEDRPFQSIVMIDGYASGGRPLSGGIPAYEKMAADCAYQLLFTPLGVKHNSIADNEVRDAVAMAGENRTAAYTGMGMSALIYPMAEVEDYLAMRFAELSLSDQWLLLDKMYLQARIEYQGRKQAGDSNAQEPDRGDLYVRSLDDFARDSAPLLYRQIRDELYVRTEDSKGYEIVAVAHEQYLDTLSEKLMDAFWENTDIAGLANRQSGNMRNDDWEDEELSNVVRTKELRLGRLQDSLKTHLSREPGDHFRTLWVGAEMLGTNEHKDWHLQKYLYSGSAHPVKARYFLYSLQALTEDRLEAANNKLAANQKRLENLQRIFDDPATKNDVEQPVYIARKTEDAHWFKRLVGKDIKGFKQRYMRYHQDYHHALKEYGTLKARVTIYESLLIEVRKLTRVLEQLFDSLNRFSDDLQRDISENEQRHALNRSAGDTSIYVLADADSKQALWEVIEHKIGGAATNTEANLSLLRSTYESYKDRAETQISRFSPEPESFDGAELYRKEVVDGFCLKYLRNNLSADYSFHIAEAIKRGAVLNNESVQQYLRRLGNTAMAQSKPFLDTETSDQNDVCLWAITPTVVADLGGREEVRNSLIKGISSASLVIEKAFDDDRIICFQFRLNLSVENLTRFQPGGEYEAAYSEIHDQLAREEDDVNRQTPPSVFTHHVHKDWHRPGILASCSCEADEQLLENALSAWVTGWAIAEFEERSVNRKKHIYFNNVLLVEDNTPETLIKSLVSSVLLREQVQSKAGSPESADEWKSRIDRLADAELLFRILQVRLYSSKQDYVKTAIRQWFIALHEAVNGYRPTSSDRDNYDYFKNRVSAVLKELKTSKQFNNLTQNDQAGFCQPVEDELKVYLKVWGTTVVDNERRGAR